MEVEREGEKIVIPSVGVLLIKNNKVLLVKHGKKAEHKTGVYGLPAGRLKTRESEKQAAVRELFEETGLRTTEKELVNYPGNTYTAEITRKEGQTLFSIKVFLCDNYSGILISNDETEPEWVDISKLSSYNLLPNVKKAIEDGSRFINKQTKI